MVEAHGQAVAIQPRRAGDLERQRGAAPSDRFVPSKKHARIGCRRAQLRHARRCGHPGKARLVEPVRPLPARHGQYDRSAPKPCSALIICASSPSVMPWRMGISTMPTKDSSPVSTGGPSMVMPSIGFGTVEHQQRNPRATAENASGNRAC